MDSAPHRTHLVLSLYKRKIVRAFDLLIDHVQNPELLQRSATLFFFKSLPNDQKIDQTAG
jgi:hypothetical protein